MKRGWQANRAQCVAAMYLTATKGFPGFNEPKKWSPAFQDFVRQCFHMNPIARADCDQLLHVRCCAQCARGAMGT